MLQLLIASCLLITSLLGHTNTLKPIQISVGEWPPFISQSQKHNGFIADLIHDVLQASGYQVTYKSQIPR